MEFKIGENPANSNISEEGERKKELVAGNTEKENDNIFSPEKKLEIKNKFSEFHESKCGCSLEVCNNLKNAREKEEEAIVDFEFRYEKEADKDIGKENIEKFINSKFDEFLLKASYIESFRIDFGTIIVYLEKDNPFEMEKGNYLVPKKIFEEILQSDEERKCFSKYIFRAGSNANYYMDGELLYSEPENNIEIQFYLATPISVYNQEYDQQNIGLTDNEDLDGLGLSYLESIDKDKRKEAYKLGTISHEVGHHIYAYFIYNKDGFEEWKKIIDRCGNVTEYAGKHEKENEKSYDENFAEAIRIYTTCCEYFEDDNQGGKKREIIKFIEEQFGDLISKSGSEVERNGVTKK